MKKAFQILLISIFLSFVVLANAQPYEFSTKNKKALKSYKAAEQAYRLFDYSEALQNLNHAVKKDKYFIEAWLLMGDVYTELNHRTDAISAFQKAVQIDSTFFPRAYFFVGNLAFEIGDYSLSEDNFKIYLRFEDEQELTKLLGEKGLERAQYANYLISHPAGNQPVNMGKLINTSSDEYVNFVNESHEKLVLTRKSEIGTDARNQVLFEERFFESRIENKEWSEPALIKLAWQEGLNLGGMNLSVDGRKMYFTGCNWPEGFGSCDLFVSYKLGNYWESPSNLGTRVNSQWWDSQPVVSSDGNRIYFSSKRSGGKGGSDIWMSIRLENRSWSPPVNLGDSINTTANEMSPFLHADGSTLYFSSDGHFGLGGADLFISRKDELGRWSKAKNLGYPINSKYNDINLFMSIDGSIAFISSDRKEGQGGFDLYQTVPEEFIKPQEVYFVKGIVVDKSTLKPVGARVEITDLLDGIMVNETNSDPKTGEFLMVLNPSKEYAFNISKPNYLFYSEYFTASGAGSLSSVDKFFKIDPITTGKQLVLENVFFDFDQSRLKQKSFNELERLHQLLVENEAIKIEIGGHTDNVGDELYNQHLSEDRARIVYEYLINKGISAERISYKGFGDSLPISDNNNEEGRSKNRRTEITIF